MDNKNPGPLETVPGRHHTLAAEAVRARPRAHFDELYRAAEFDGQDGVPVHLGSNAFSKKLEKLKTALAPTSRTTAWSEFTAAFA
jgi:hypothetical protein